MRMHRRLIGILVLGMVVLAMVQVVGAETAQTWYFTSEGAPSPLTGKIMTKGIEGGDTVITLGKGERVWFYADEVALCDVSFPSDGSWDVAYWVKALHPDEFGNGSVYTRVGYADSAGETVRKLSRSAGIKHPTEIEEIVEEGVAIFTVPKGGRLAVEVYWGSSPKGDLEIHCNPSGAHASKLTSPSSDPGYPVPELSTLILFSVGLLVLAGYVALRRNNK